MSVLKWIVRAMTTQQVVRQDVQDRTLRQDAQQRTVRNDANGVPNTRRTEQVIRKNF